MCLCGGTGGIHIRESSGVLFAPCPDSNCTFDREKADREWDEWVAKALEYYELVG